MILQRSKTSWPMDLYRIISLDIQNANEMKILCISETPPWFTDTQ